MSLSSRLPATRHRDFRALWGGTACSSISLWTLLLGNAWVVFKLSNSSAWVGVATFASMSPFLLAPLGGLIADRFERRNLVVITRLASLATAAALCLLAVTNVLAVWMVVVVAFVQGVVRTVETSAEQALLANVVPQEDLGNAISLTTMAQLGSRAVGPLLAGPLLATIGVEGAYAIATAFSLLALAAVMQVRTSSRGGVLSLGAVTENLREGFAYVVSNRPVLAVFALMVAHCSLTMSFDAMLPGFAETELHKASGGFTLMTMGVGVGSLVGVFALALATTTRRGLLFLAMGIASGLAPVMMGLSTDLRWAVFSTILMGSSQAVFVALAATLLQEVIADAVRGRVMSLYLMSAGGIMAVANLAFGSLADRWGAPVLFWAPGALFVAIVAATVLGVPDLRRTYRTGRMGVRRVVAVEGVV